MNKTSKEDYEYFQKQVTSYQKQLGLTDWKIYFEHYTHENSMAWIKRDQEGRCCTIGLSIDWAHQKVSRDMIKSCARHEVLHLLLADLRLAGNKRQTTDEDFTIAEHSIIRRLENWKE